MAIYDKVRGGYRVFIGDLGSRIDRRDVERELAYFGPLLDVWVARNPPGFGFVVFKNSDDAERAVKNLHGRSLCGRRVRVEHAFESGAKKEERQKQEAVRRHDGPYRRSRSRSRSRAQRRSPSYESRRRSTTSRRSPYDEPRRGSSRAERRSPSYDSGRPPYRSQKRTRSRSRSHSIHRNSYQKRSENSEKRGGRSPSKKSHRDSSSTSRSRSRSTSKKRAVHRSKSGSSSD